MSLKTGSGKRELVAASISSRRFSRVVVESSQPSAAESMSPREQKKATSLSDSTWTLLCGLPSKGHAVTWHHVHLISVSFAKRLSQKHFCVPSACSCCRRCCCCPLQYNRWLMETRLNSAGVRARTTDHDLRLSCIFLVLSPPLLLSKSRVS